MKFNINLPLALLMLMAAVSAWARPVVTIPRIATAPVIDGRLGKTEWQGAARITDFKDVEPIVGAKPSEATIAYLAYDSNTIYIAIRCLTNNPNSIVAHQLREDEDMSSDDTVSVALDSLHDGRNAYVFMVNPLGTRRDFRVENDINYRPEWNGIWYAAARRDAHGWTAELAIPVKTLSFVRGHTWGLEIQRTIRRRNEVVRWANISQNRDFADASAYGDLRGLTGLNQGVGLDVMPMLTAHAHWNAHRHDWSYHLKPGGEFIYKITPSLKASLILNPDFSDATPDLIQTNLTRWALYFPEQRDFFVRDANIFDFGGLQGQNGTPFFSRRIGLVGDTANPPVVNMDVGVKLSGRAGPVTLGLLDTQMEPHDGIGARNLAVARAAVDVLSESRLGMIMTYGNPDGSNNNALIGTDFHYRDSNVLPGRAVTVDTYLMRSFTAGLHGHDMAWGLRLNYPNDTWNGSVDYTEIQQNFNPALGFVNRPGIRDYHADLRYRLRPGSPAWLRTYDVGFGTDLTTGLDNQLQSGWWGARLLTVGTQSGDSAGLWFDYNYDRLPEPFEISPGISIPVGGYAWPDLWGWIKSATDRPVSGQLEWVVGRYYNGKQTDVRVRLAWRPTPRFYLAVEHRIINTWLPRGNFAVSINRAWFQVNFNPRVSWSSLLQQETESHFITLNSQLRWIITPGNVLTVTVVHDWLRQLNSYRPTKLDLYAKLFWTHRF